MLFIFQNYSHNYYHFIYTKCLASVILKTNHYKHDKPMWFFIWGHKVYKKTIFIKKKHAKFSLLLWGFFSYKEQVTVSSQSYYNCQAQHWVTSCPSRALLHCTPSLFNNTFYPLFCYYSSFT